MLHICLRLYHTEGAVCLQWWSHPYNTKHWKHQSIMTWGIQLIAHTCSLQQVWEALECPTEEFRNQEIKANNILLAACQLVQTEPVHYRLSIALSWTPMYDASNSFYPGSCHVCELMHPFQFSKCFSSQTNMFGYQRGERGLECRLRILWSKARLLCGSKQDGQNL